MYLFAVQSYCCGSSFLSFRPVLWICIGFVRIRIQLAVQLVWVLGSTSVLKNAKTFATSLFTCDVH